MARTKKSNEKFLGQVEMVSLDGIRPNPWNANELTTAQMMSLREGFRSDGWVLSQSLLVWRTDENGVIQNLVIDGEHRLRIAHELGFTQGPVVFLDGITRAEAMALNTKLDNKRGKPNRDKLRVNIRELMESDLHVDAISLGFSETEFIKLQEDEPIPELEGDALPSGKANVSTTLHLAFNAEDLKEFKRLTKRGAATFEKEDVSQVVLEALRLALPTKGRAKA